MGDQDREADARDYAAAEAARRNQDHRDDANIRGPRT